MKTSERFKIVKCGAFQLAFYAPSAINKPCTISSISLFLIPSFQSPLTFTRFLTSFGFSPATFQGCSGISENGALKLELSNRALTGNRGNVYFCRLKITLILQTVPKICTVHSTDNDVCRRPYPFTEILCAERNFPHLTSASVSV